MIPFYYRFETFSFHYTLYCVLKKLLFKTLGKIINKMGMKFTHENEKNDIQSPTQTEKYIVMLSTKMLLPSMPSSSMIGNCKGIMLCNHPPYYHENNNNQKQSQQQQNNNISKSSFICGIVPKPWGSINKPEDCDNDGNNNYCDEEQHVLKQQRSKQILKRMQNKKVYLTKHKQWLHNLQKEKEELKLQNNIEKIDKEEKKRKFMEREASKRAWVYDARNNNNNLNNHSDDCDYYDDNYYHVIEDDDEDKALFDIATSNDNNKESIINNNALKENGNMHNHQEYEEKMKVNSTENNSSKIKNKPVWALTKEKAKEEEDNMQEKEENDLLSFVDKLNFDKYNDDLEVKILMKQLNERIVNIEKENNQNEAQLENILQVSFYMILYFCFVCCVLV